MSDPPFLSLDFLYTPSRDVAADLAVFEDILGASVRFAIDGMGTRVAAVDWLRARHSSCSPTIWRVNARSPCSASTTSRQR
jgi:hypothetical protein